LTWQSPEIGHDVVMIFLKILFLFPLLLPFPKLLHTLGSKGVVKVNVMLM
jgi:hypothetical protein